MSSPLVSHTRRSSPDHVHCCSTSARRFQPGKNTANISIDQLKSLRGFSADSKEAPDGHMVDQERNEGAGFGRAARLELIESLIHFDVPNLERYAL
jgi:hypothetical protein